MSGDRRHAGRRTAVRPAAVLVVIALVLMLPGAACRTAPAAVPASPTVGTLGRWVEPAPGRPPPMMLVLGEAIVPGELGSFTWAGASEAAPWLPAVALLRSRAPAGERARARGEAPVRSWSALAVPVADPAPERPMVLGEGDGMPDFRLPAGTGEWVVSLRVLYPGGRGDAAWYWRLLLE